MEKTNRKTASSRTLAFALAIAFAVILPSAVTATQCISSVAIDADLSTKATTGSDVALSVTPSGSCSGGEVSLSLSYSPNTLTVSNPSTGSYTGINTGTTKSFTITASTTGVYNITAVGTTSDGSVESTPLYVEFVNPSTLTVAGSPSSATILFNAAATLQINVTNPTAEDITTSYSLSVPSGLTASGDPSSSSASLVSAAATNSYTWTITHSTCFTGTKTITLTLGDNSNAFSSTITGNTTCGGSNATTTTGTTGGGGGTNATVTNLTVKKLSTTTVSGSLITVSVPSIAVNTIETLDMSAGNAELVGINTIGIVVKAAQGKFRYFVSPLDSRPSSIAADPAGNLYRFIEITTENISASNVKTVEISIEVNKTWVAANNIDANTIALYRYTTTWDKLTTAKTSEDSNKYYYKATSLGFSVFAVAGEVVQQPTTPPGGAPPTGGGAPAGGEGGAPPAAAPQPIPEGTLYAMLGVIVVGVVIVVLIKFVLPKWRERKISYRYKKAKE